MKIGRYTVRDTHNYGTIDLTHVISKSSNVGVTKIALSMPAEKLWRLYRNLGIGAVTGIRADRRANWRTAAIQQVGGNRPCQSFIRLWLFPRHPATGASL